MILGQLGAAVLLAGLVLAVFAAGLGFWSGWKSQALLGWVAMRAFWAAAAAVGLACAALVAALAASDFRLAYVVEHTDLSTPLPLKVAAFYGGQEGSLLYWTLVLALLGAISLGAARPLGGALAAYATAVLASLLTFFLVLLVFVTSPFELLFMAPPDGLGLNPLLRDGGMLIHPPFLLAGMSSFAVPFSFALAALLTGRPGSPWIALTRRVALLAWGLQSAGLVLGMWWAYHVLGWGGYWGWDPVENVALLPWLATTAYIHSSQVEERRGSLTTWNFALVILAFCLAIFGTFVVRSGIVQSVHAFAVSSLGPWFLAFLGVLVASSLFLLASRGPNLRGAPVERVVSREGAFYLNNLVFLGIAGAVLWGTLLPIFSQIGGGAESVVGASFYERVTSPLFLALLALLAVGPLIPWRPGDRSWMAGLRWPLTMGLGLAVALAAGGDHEPGQLLLGILLGAAFTTCLREFSAWLRPSPQTLVPTLSGLGRFRRQRRRYAAHLVHLGFLVLAAGIAGSHLWQQERAVELRPGQTVTLAGYRLTFEGLTEANLVDSTRTTARLDLGSEQLQPSHSVYPSWGGQTSTQVAIRSDPLEDLYVVLGGTQGDSASFLIFINPLVTWVWAGGAILVLGVIVGHWNGPAPLPAADRRRARVAPSGVTG